MNLDVVAYSVDMSSAAKYINFKSSTADRDGNFSHITECVDIANKNGGWIFGGFLRDVIFPMSRGSTPHELNFKDIDIWFNADDLATTFIADVNRSVNIRIDRSKAVDPKAYGKGRITRNQYHLFHNGLCIAWINVVVSRTVPVDDFDVNMLFYSGRSFADPIWGIDEDATKYTIDELLDKLARGKMGMLGTFVFRLADKGRTGDLARNHLQKFLSQGWDITASPIPGKDLSITDTHPFDIEDDAQPSAASSAVVLDSVAPIVTVEHGALHTKVSGKVSTTLANGYLTLVTGITEMVRDMIIENVEGLTETQKRQIIEICRPPSKLSSEPQLP